MKRKVGIQLIFCVMALCLSGLVSAGSAGESAAGEKREAVFRLYASYEHEFPSVKSISAQQALALHRQGQVVFVDVRTSDEKAVSLMPGAVGAEAYKTDPARYEGRTVVAYCTIGYRSGVFAEKMAAQGVAVLNLEGGVLAWLWEGGELVDGAGRAVKRVHVYAQKWDLAPPVYETATFGFFQRWF